MSSVPKPKYTIWEAISAALALAGHAIEEARSSRKFQNLGLGDFSVEFDNERTITLVVEKDGQTSKFPIRLPTMLDRGVWRAGSYQKGDAVSFGGSLFIAQRDTEDKPETGDAWRLAVKRGRDGSEGKIGRTGPPGPTIVEWEVQGYRAVPILSDGSAGAMLDFRQFFELYHGEAQR